MAKLTSDQKKIETILEEKAVEKASPFIPKTTEEIKKEKETEMFQMVEDFKKLKQENPLGMRDMTFSMFRELKIKEKNLLKNKLVQLDLKYPDKKIIDKNGLVNKENAKEAIKEAVVDLEIEPIDGLKLQRSVNTEGEQSVTAGEYSIGNFNFSSPNLEEGKLTSEANFNLGDLNLTAATNTNDSELLNSELGFNYNNELKGSVFNEDDYRKTNIELDKTFELADNINANLKGRTDISTFDGETYRSSDLTPQLSYNDGILSADISKEILEGGSIPKFNLGVKKNGFYARGDNLLSEDRGGTIGYEKTLGDKDGDFYFTAGGEIEPFSGEKTIGGAIKYKFAKGGRVRMASGGIAQILKL